MAASRGGHPPPDRLRAGDRTVLATDRGPAPMNIAALLELDPGAHVSVADLTAALSSRIGRVPRLRQRLWKPRHGLSRWRAPVWVDDPRFGIDRQLEVVAGPDTADPCALLDLAAALATQRLPRDRPLWRACIVQRSDGEAGALVIVLHHVVTDGLGGLAVLAALADRPAGARRPAAQPLPPRPESHPPESHPYRAAGHRLVAGLRRGAAGLRELGLTGGGRPRLADRVWFVAPTGPRRRAAVAQRPLAQLVEIAHAWGGTVNDVVLTAVSGALLDLAAAAGDHPRELVISVPISGRRSTTAGRLGNDTGVRPIAVPAVADDGARLAAVVERTRSRRGLPRASSGVPLGLAFRVLARLGLFLPFIEHQRLVHTFQTNLRGPAAPVRLAGAAVTRIVPITVTPGNVAVHVAVLSYAGTMSIVVIADPDVLPEPQRVAEAMAMVVDRLSAALSPGVRPG
ncbi:MAG TPA: wax ester/triacylglycerol synthase domain-containing protein [Microlunatus sp.]|nr:wax ester/triacylglycerol synthase domain-containing protein [Microlunatus sp.]